MVPRVFRELLEGCWGPGWSQGRPKGVRGGSLGGPTQGAFRGVTRVFRGVPGRVPKGFGGGSQECSGESQGAIRVSPKVFRGSRGGTGCVQGGSLGHPSRFWGVPGVFQRGPRGFVYVQGCSEGSQAGSRGGGPEGVSGVFRGSRGGPKVGVPSHPAPRRRGRRGCGGVAALGDSPGRAAPTAPARARPGPPLHYRSPTSSRELGGGEGGGGKLSEKRIRFLGVPHPPTPLTHGAELGDELLLRPLEPLAGVGGGGAKGGAASAKRGAAGAKWGGTGAAALLHGRDIQVVNQDDVGVLRGEGEAGQPGLWFWRVGDPPV